MSRPRIVWPGAARLTLVLMAVVPAVLAYPWSSTRERWVLGVAAAVLLALLPWWHGMHLTTMVRRRLAMLRRGHGEPSHRKPATDLKATALLRVTAPGNGPGGPDGPGGPGGPDVPDLLPLPLIAGYLDRYGIRADAIRITSRGSATHPAGRQTWIGLTLSAADNLVALQARSARIPLPETTEVAVRRLADHLRELGWNVTGAGADDIPPLLTPGGREGWHGVSDGDGGHVAAYRVNPDDSLSDTLAAIWSQPEAWSAVELAPTAGGLTVAVACALRTHRPGTSPIPGLIPQQGNHRAALRALDPVSPARLDGQGVESVELLSRLRWPAGSDVASFSRT